MALPTMLFLITSVAFLATVILYFAPLPRIVGRIGWVVFGVLLVITLIVLLTSPAFANWVQNAKFEPANFVRDLWENQIFD